MAEFLVAADYNGRVMRKGSIPDEKTIKRRNQ